VKVLESDIRIGLVIGQLSQGGAERQITRLAVELAQHSSYVPIVFCMSAYTDPYGAELSKAGIKWFVPPGNIKSGLFKLFWLIRQVSAVHCGLLYGFLHVGNIYAGAAALFLQTPFIASIRSATSTLSPILLNLSRFFLNRADIIVGNSDSCLRILNQELYVTHQRVTIIPNIIFPVVTSQEARLRLREQWGVTTEPVIGTIALIKEDKRPWLFLETCVALNARMPARFVWVGDGPQKRSLEDQVALLGSQLSSRIHLEGFQKDIAAYLSAFDIFILTSAYEGSPNALMEAMSAHKVCVATRVPGITDVFVGQPLSHPVGVLCDPDDPQKIAQAIADVWLDKILMREMGQNAHQWVHTRYSSENIIETYSLLFNRSLSSSSYGRTRQ